MSEKSPSALMRWAGPVAVVGVAAALLAARPWESFGALPRKPLMSLPAADADANAEPDAFADERGGDAPKKRAEKIVAIDAKRTMGYLEAVCKIGPRISGTPGMKKQQELIEKHFTDLGATVTYQKFTAKQKSVAKAVEMANMVVSYNPKQARRIIVCSHYDTRPIADQEANLRNWTMPFVSANDGGSGVALLMELGHHMKDIDPAIGVDFVFFDGEEYIFKPSQDEYFFGSKHFGEEYKKAKKTKTYVGAVLLDMIAGKGAVFPVEQNSAIRAGKLVKEIWALAQELKCEVFDDNYSKFAVEDDHIPLNRAGIPAIDIIDFEYPHWHKLTDVPKNCDAKAMEQVAKVLGVWMQRAK